ncbi:hypothetical protein LOZ61_006211 [Ophidiomyces ophidiicola]|uniref:Uncharacterized protein n=1 Tax=Ophidiomyces ophidiicola TaxID=1387563 RepID=A0ACB8UT29_9EURO|nr:hypothetical protein LOZ61_006211 [Ophidiomyces ophidiicola]KAI1911508.1 hypothetical protein LOZ64_004702 [Ophidiomyces ophidiicola]KAI1922289.1 hypothetical protein LOZ60_005819 [Ophidiomyces ophidiicola]KAI1950622.1 hypothetical protein LOZ59_005820 [Ophidiomyces ophidiicola]KAI1968662.1 hypothetical protein LOZ56_004928 [Ophidiomyces ophidiicola]
MAPMSQLAGYSLLINPRTTVDWNSWPPEHQGGVLAASILLFLFLFALGVWFFSYKRAKESVRDSAEKTKALQRHKSQSLKEHRLEEGPEPLKADSSFAPDAEEPRTKAKSKKRARSRGQEGKCRASKSLKTHGNETRQRSSRQGPRGKPRHMISGGRTTPKVRKGRQRVEADGGSSKYSRSVIVTVGDISGLADHGRSQ